MPVPAPQPGDNEFFGTYGFPMMMMSGVISGVGDLVNANNQATALKTQAAYQTWSAGENLARAKTQTAQVAQETQFELAAAGNRANATIGAQRTGYASQGVNVNSGTPLDEQVNTGKMSAVDAMTIRNNGALKAWGINTGAQQTAAEQMFQAQGERTQATQSLALGGARAANDVMSQVDQFEVMRSRAI